MLSLPTSVTPMLTPSMNQAHSAMSLPGLLDLISDSVAQSRLNSVGIFNPGKVIKKQSVTPKRIQGGKPVLVNTFTFNLKLCYGQYIIIS